jgi:DNA polymerase III delta prime subunit
MGTVIAEKTTKRVVLEPGRRNSEVEGFEAKLRSKIVGQDEAVSQMVNIYETVVAGMTMPGHPIANLLFLGPTGSGKTRIVEAAAEILFGSPNAFLKVDCAEFQHSHEIAKLLGSPPGYIGHRETRAVLNQEAIDAFHTESLKMTFHSSTIEISDALWRLLLKRGQAATRATTQRTSPRRAFVMTSISEPRDEPPHDRRHCFTAGLANP